MTATRSASATRTPSWIGWLAPLALVAVLVGVFLAFNPIGSLREVPPAEVLAVERTIMHEDSIELRVRNDGPDEVTVAQVLVNDAYRPFRIGDAGLGRLEQTTITIPYPWEDGMPLNIALLTATGVTIEHEIEAASLTPEADPSTFLTYGLLGVYIGLIPVVVGLLWFSSLRRAAPRWIAFFLAFTVGLLAFLLVDTVAEGLELAGETGAALDGIGLFGIGAVASFAALIALGNGLAKARRTQGLSGLPLAYFIAAGIGLHNLGEGLAVGAALAAGEVALGTFLVLGFMLHNTTEGLAIVAPLGSERERPALKHFVLLGVVAGIPTVFGAWAGGFAFAPAWAALAFGVAVGAIAQVIWAVGRTLPAEYRLGSPVGAAGLIAGLLVMYSTGLLTA
ncbi:MAG TPA: ZIP family metal transporter [Actinomycetota bacterium]|nr:ZIP family metal transporter [Actinomycetota bacterium]